MGEFKREDFEGREIDEIWKEKAIAFNQLSLTPEAPTEDGGDATPAKLWDPPLALLHSSEHHFVIAVTRSEILFFDSVDTRAEPYRTPLPVVADRVRAYLFDKDTLIIALDNGVIQKCPVPGLRSRPGYKPLDEHKIDWGAPLGTIAWTDISFLESDGDSAAAILVKDTEKVRFLFSEGLKEENVFKLDGSGAGQATKVLWLDRSRMAVARTNGNIQIYEVDFVDDQFDRVASVTLRLDLPPPESKLICSGMHWTMDDEFIVSYFENDTCPLTFHAVILDEAATTATVGLIGEGCFPNMTPVGERWTSLALVEGVNGNQVMTIGSPCSDELLVVEREQSSGQYRAIGLPESWRPILPVPDVEDTACIMVTSAKEFVKMGGPPVNILIISTAVGELLSFHVKIFELNPDFSEIIDLASLASYNRSDDLQFSNESLTSQEQPQQKVQQVRSPPSSDDDEAGSEESIPPTPSTSDDENEDESEVEDSVASRSPFLEIPSPPLPPKKIPLPLVEGSSRMPFETILTSFVERFHALLQDLQNRLKDIRAIYSEEFPSTKEFVARLQVCIQRSYNYGNQLRDIRSNQMDKVKTDYVLARQKCDYISENLSEIRGKFDRQRATSASAVTAVQDVRKALDHLSSSVAEFEDSAKVDGLKDRMDRCNVLVDELRKLLPHNGEIDRMKPVNRGPANYRQSRKLKKRFLKDFSNHFGLNVADSHPHRTEAPESEETPESIDWEHRQRLRGGKIEVRKMRFVDGSYKVVARPGQAAEEEERKRKSLAAGEMMNVCDIGTILEWIGSQNAYQPSQEEHFPLQTSSTNSTDPFPRPVLMERHPFGVAADAYDGVEEEAEEAVASEEEELYEEYSDESADEDENAPPQNQGLEAEVQKAVAAAENSNEGVSPHASVAEASQPGDHAPRSPSQLSTVTSFSNVRAPSSVSFSLVGSSVVSDARASVPLSTDGSHETHQTDETKPRGKSLEVLTDEENDFLVVEQPKPKQDPQEPAHAEPSTTLPSGAPPAPATSTTVSTTEPAADARTEAAEQEQVAEQPSVAEATAKAPSEGDMEVESKSVEIGMANMMGTSMPATSAAPTNVFGSFSGVSPSSAFKAPSTGAGLGGGIQPGSAFGSLARGGGLQSGVFGTQTFANPMGAFGSQSTPAASAFGQPANFGSGSSFGQPSSLGGGSAFGQPSSLGGTFGSSFGAAAQPGGASGFAKFAGSGGSGFGGVSGGNQGGFSQFAGTQQGSAFGSFRSQAPNQGGSNRPPGDPAFTQFR